MFVRISRAWKFLAGPLAAGVLIALILGCAVPAASPVPAGEASPTANPVVLSGKAALAPRQEEPIRFTILHTNDTRGHVDPCG